MKRTNKFLAALTAMTVAVSSFGMICTNAAEGPELIKAGSFEETNGAVVYGLGNSAAVAGIEYSYAEKYEGKASAHAKFSSSAKLVNITNFGLKSGNKYNFSFMIKGDLHDNGMYMRMGGWSYSANAAKIIEKDGEFKESGTGDALVKITPESNGWYKVESETPWTCGSGTGDEAILLYPQKNGDIYIDNFSITDESGKEYVVNGVFEPDTINAVVSELGNTQAISGLEYSNVVGYDDTSSIHVTKSAQLTTVSKLGLSNGSAYNFSFYIKGKLPADNGMYLRMGGWQAQHNAQIKQSNGAFYVSSSNNNLAVTEAENGWYKVETTKAWVAGASTDASAALLFPQSNGGNPDFYIDNFSITSATGSDTSGAVVTQLGNKAAVSGLEYSNVTAYNSNNSIHINVKSQTALAKTANLGMEIGKSYNFSFYIKGKLASSNGMYIRTGWNSYASNMANIKSTEAGVFSVVNGTNLTVTEATDGWYKVESNTPWPYNTSIDLFTVATGGGTIDFYIDDLSITESETGAQVVTDGGFETVSITGSELITNGGFKGHDTADTNGAVITELGNTAAVAGVEYSTADAYDGGRAVHISKIASNTVPTTSAKLGMEVGKSYNFSFYIKGILSTSNGMYIRTGWNSYDSNMAKIKSTAEGVFSVAGGTNLTFTQASDGWYKVESKTPWPNTSGIDFITVTKDGGTVDFYIDKLSIREAIADEVIGSFEMTGETGEKTVTVSVTNNGHADGYSAILILATYKGDTMQDVAMADTETVVELGKTETLTEMITVNEGETLTAFLWDSLDGMKPLTTSDELVTVTLQ